MHQKWENFLALNSSKHASNIDSDPLSILEKHSNYIVSIAQLSVLTVSGSDACQFLQGQATCDFNALNESKGTFGAFCNSKGRTISPFLALKKADDYLLILPLNLLATVRKKLQKYILRSDIKIIDQSEKLCLIGLINAKSSLQYPKEVFETLHNPIITKYPSSVDRFLLIADPQEAINLWSSYVHDHEYQSSNTALWMHLDIIAGIPWLTKETSEEFIPQMLNLDQLGGISFNKGCYTGQEIVARTHYLGKTKRQMYLAVCQIHEVPQSNSAILTINADTEKTIGKILVAQNFAGLCYMLVVLHTSDVNSENICLDNQENTKLKVSNLPQLINL